jgi:O-antigen/teichoic acid export membrane protein
MDPERSKTKIEFKIFSSDILKSILTVSYNSIAIALITLIFHLVMSRKLGPEQYGILGTLMSINTIVLISLSAVGFVISRFITYYKTREQYDNMKFLANWAFIFFFFIGAAASLVNVMFSKIIASYLYIDDYNLITIFGIIVWISFLMPIIDGILRGLQEFKYLGRYKLTDALLRLIIAGIMVWIGLKIRSVITAMIISGLVTLLLAAFILKKVYITRPHRIKLMEIYKFTFPVVITMVCLAALSNIDLVLVKHFFNESTAGNFAAAGILAKIVFVIALGSAGVLFPKIVEYYSNGKNDEIRKDLNNTLKIVLLPGLLITLLFVLFPQAISGWLFGRQYDFHQILPIYSIALFFLSIAAILCLYDLAIKKYAFIPIVMAAAALLIYQINVLHSSLNNIVWILLVVDFILLAFSVFYNKEELATFFSYA